MIFVRTGPRFLFLQTTDELRLREKLADIFPGRLLPFTAAMEVAGESSTIVIINPPRDQHIDVGKINVILLPVGSSVALSRLFNEGVSQLVSRADLGPGVLVQRVPRGGHEVIETVREYYGAVSLDMEDALGGGQADDTVIFFTHQPLSRPVKMSDMINPVLLVNSPVPVMYRQLRREAVRYFTEGLKTGQWHEVRINIYDAEEEYRTHYRRLVLALEDLEAGLVLGEMWTRDHALALFSVIAYQVRLFTTMEPLELKEVLLGLEYDSRGVRFVDMDLYYRRKKIEKADVIKTLPGGVRGYGLYFRERLFSRLAEETREKILKLEQTLPQEVDR